MENEPWMLGLSRAEIEVVGHCIEHCAVDHEIKCTGPNCHHYWKAVNPLVKIALRNENDE